MRARRGSRTLILLTLLLAGFAPPTAAATHGPAATLLVNLHRGASHGCSPDAWTSPDLAARVWHGGQVVAETHKAQDESEASWLALLEVANAGAPATVAIEVREAEPGGFLGFGTSWIPCDVDPGPGHMLNVTVPGASQGVAFSGRGDGPRAASVSGHAAPATAAHPRATTLRLAEATHDTLTVQWDPQPAPAASQALHVRSREGAALAPESSSHELTGLQENTPYVMRLVREQGPWQVATGWTILHTRNLPPPAPLLHVAPAAGAAEVAWEVSVHDLARVELHVGAEPGFVPNASTLRHAAHSFQTRGSVTLDGLEGERTVYVKGVAVDKPGASNVSDGVPVTPWPTRAPAAPDAPRVEVLRDGVRVTWSHAAPQDASSYKVVLREAGAPDDVVATVPRDGPLEATLRGLEPDVAYSVLVRVVAPWNAVADSPAVAFATPPANQRPEVRILVPNGSGLVGVPLEVRAVLSSDPEGDDLTFAWSWGDGTPDGHGATARHAYARPGTYTLRLVARDALGAENATTAAVEVHPPNRPPLASLALSATLVAPGVPVVADAGGSVDPDGDRLSVTFEWGDGAAPTLGGWTAPHAYAQPGEYVVSVHVTDGKGGVARAQHRLRVEPSQPPVAALDLSASSLPIGATLRVSTAGSRDPDGGALRARIEWGDGHDETHVGEAATHAYARPGVYLVRLVVRDPHGDEAVKAIPVVVTDPAAPLGQDPHGIPATVAPDPLLRQNATGDAADAPPTPEDRPPRRFLPAPAPALALASLALAACLAARPGRRKP